MTSAHQIPRAHIKKIQLKNNILGVLTGGTTTSDPVLLSPDATRSDDKSEVSKITSILATAIVHPRYKYGFRLYPKRGTESLRNPNRIFKQLLFVGPL